MSKKGSPNQHVIDYRHVIVVYDEFKDATQIIV